MSEKYLKIGTANDPVIEKEAINQSSGVSSSGEIIAANSDGRVDKTFIPEGFGCGVKLFTVSENLAAGDFVNIYDNSGIPTARKADSTNYLKSADGFILSSVTYPGTATVYFEGENNQLSGLTIGVQWLSSSGNCSNEKPVASGCIQQIIGKAISTTSVIFNKGDVLRIA